MDLVTLPGRFAVCRLAPEDTLPAWAMGARPLFVAATDEELSVVCPSERVPAGVRAEGPWRALRVRGTLDFALTGVLASLAAPLAAAGISLFAISTFDTDYVLVREGDLVRALTTLAAAGHRLVPATGGEEQA